jgi:hypothetical protein
MVEVILVTLLVEEALFGLWLVGESERAVVQAMTERMVQKTRELQREVAVVHRAGG